MDIKYESAYARKIKAKERNGTAILNRIAVELLSFAVGASLNLAQMPFAANTLGIAALCASAEQTVAMFLGLLITSALVPYFNSKIIILIYAVAFAVRLLIGLFRGWSEKTGREIISGIFKEGLSARAILCGFACFGVGLYRLMLSGFLYYDLFGTVTGIVVGVVATVLWYPLRDKRQWGCFSAWRAAGALCLCFACIWGLRDIRLYGVSLSVFAAMLTTLFITRRKGLLWGAFTAIFAGLAVSVSYAPLFIFSAVCYAVLFSVSPLLSSVAAFISGMAWGIYIGGISAFTMLLPALLSANFLFFAADKIFLSSPDADDEKNVEDTQNTHNSSGNIALARLDDASGHIKMLCDGFYSLSDMLLKMSDKAVCSEAKEARKELMMEIGDIENVDYVRTDLYYDTLRSELLALDIRAISDYLAEWTTENSGTYEVDEILSRRVEKEILRPLSPTENIGATVFGGKQKRAVVTCDARECIERSIGEIEKTVGDVCGVPMICGEVKEFEGKAYVMLRQRAVLEATFAGRKQNALGESEFCGDSFGTVRSSTGGKSIGFISDGMGSGREAAISSCLCVLLLQKLLGTDIGSHERVEAAFSLINSFLRSYNGIGKNECSASVDLGVFDLVECEAHFYKSGAAPTYVFRDGSLFKLRARTVPLGILDTADVGRIDMELLPGDTVIMVSDGVTEGREECPELFDYLRSRLLTHNAEQLADSIIKYADKRGCTDDVSVLVTKVSEKIMTT